MKRRQRRPVLTIDKPQSTHHVEHIQSRYKPVNNIQPAQNEVDNPLANLLCQYNSDSDTEDPKKEQVQKLDDKVNDFFKEIQLIAPERPICNVAKDPNLATKVNPQSIHGTSQQTLWQECYDKSSGYPYYWHIETDEVTWDMPEELRSIRKQSEMESVIKPLVQGPHWVDFSSIAYQQSQANIPEGMIPQEVVARNRNRFIRKETPKKCISESKIEIKNKSPTKDDDSDDGRIEMITSFGSDGSDSEDENKSSDKKKASLKSGNFTSVPFVKNSEIGPVFCPTGMQSSTKNLPRPYKLDSTKSVNISNSTNPSEKFDENKTAESDGNSSTLPGEKEFSIENKNKKDVIKHNTVPKLDVNVSLVPGYGDDSDVEEEVKPRQEIKPLFPIAQDEDYVSTISTLKDTHGVFTKSSSSVQSSDQSNDDNGDIRETKGDHEKPEEKEAKTDEDKSKTNIFLEDMQVCGKAFQRKKRIAFDVTSNKIKQNSVHHDNAVQDDNSDLTSNGVTSHTVEDCDVETHNPSCTEDPMCEETHEATEQCISAKPEEKLASKEESCDSEVAAEHKTSDPVEERTNEEVNDLLQIITEKLKFLSEARESVSAVQTMQIQLQTLSTAWGASSLEESYFQKWLTNTNHELERLEQDAAPAGWLCQWDRSHKQYYYHNTSTGTSQWTYPDTGIAGGTEEMELCTTPPPPESDELSVTGSPGTKKPKEKQAEEMDVNKMDDENGRTEGHPADAEVPPPPQMSNPTTSPPPSRIFEEEPKKDKRKREKSDDKSLDVKRKRLGKERIATLDTTQAVNPTLESLSYAHPQAAVSPQTSISTNHVNMEPLPPGVDLPDTSYEAATLKGIMYNATSQPSNAIYASSMADPTIPILSHQPGLLQEPFVHYSAFHPHLHNTAAIAVANKHGGQGAIQFMLGYAPIYPNNKIIAKPPVKAAKESLGSALDSFYSDIALIERSETERAAQHHQETPVMEQQVPAPATEEVKLPETESESVPCDTTMKEKKKKKSRISISKKHKEMSTMVAKWQRVQKNLEDTV